MQKLSQYLLANSLRLNVAILLCVLIPFFPVGFVATGLIAFVTLQCDLRRALGALAWALLPVIAVNFKFSVFDQLALYYDSIFVLCVLALAFAGVLRYFRSWSRLIEIVGILNVLMFAVFLTLPTELTQTFIANLDTQIAQLDMGAVTPLHAVPVYVLLSGTFQMLTLSALMALTLGRVWQLHLIAPLQKRTEFYHIRMSRLATTLAGIVFLAGVVTSAPWALALIIYAFVLFVFAGVSLVRFVVAHKVKSTVTAFAVLVMTFLLLLFAWPIATGILAILCVADSWIDLRRSKLLA